MDGIESTLQGEDAPTRADVVPSEGARIGRYIVLGRLGAGGMGVVLTAFDPTLDRRIALKLLLPHARDAEQGRRRLLREAQALARLRHANVVAVHDVGEHGDAVYIAMELVQGRTIREWLREGRRHWREVAAVFAQAARGLAAAHDVGLVHRDFKPDNAIIGDDGRVCVLDFGLARALDSAPASAEREPVGDATARAMERVRTRMRELGKLAVVSPSPPPTELVASRITDPLTREGAIIGTPSYMAPEQIVGDQVDARCDQYSLCVSIFEALHGQRPYAGATAAALVLSIREAAPRTSDARVPSWLQRLVMRGLAPDPAQRHASMRVLADTLEQAPGRRRRVVLGTGALALTVGAIAVVNVDADPCGDAQTRLGEAWSAAARRDTIAALGEITLPYAESTASQVATRLDAYATEWIAMYEDACRATHEHGTQSATLLDRRVACLDGRRRAMAQFVGFLQTPDPSLLERAVEAVDRLPPVAECGELGRLLGSAAAPADPVARTHYDTAHDHLARATAAELAGRYAEGVELADVGADEARAAHIDALTAEIELVRARLLDGAGRREDADAALRTAVYHAQLGDDAHGQAEAAIELVYLVGYRASRFDEGKWWAALARGLVDREPERALAARLDNHLGVLLHAAGDAAPAIDLLQSALATRARILGETHLDVAESHYNLAIALRRANRLDDAVHHHERALAIRVASLGPDHPRVAESRAQIGIVAAVAGDVERATAELSAAVAIQRAALGPGHPRLAATLGALASARSQAGDAAAAEAGHREALAILDATLGADDVQVDRARHNLAVTLGELGRHAEARDLFAQVATARHRRLGAAHPDLGRTLTQLGRTRLLLGEHVLALVDLERAVAILAPGTDAVATARAQLGLALVLDAMASDAVRARTLAIAARDAFAAAGTAGAAGLAEAETLLAAG
jgi:tetratricopeptide (TPR) repeat protein/predicted Ser/Thr protein kinase